MTSESLKRKAVALISGGLDSMLAAKLMLDQGIHVEGINFFTGFCVEGHTHAIRAKHKEKPKRNNALWVAEQLGIKLHIIDIVEQYKDVVLNPKYGYGKYLNPCLDCKIFMVREAQQWREQNNFDFIITGEVIGQRPKSQRKAYMEIVKQKSAGNDRLLRPLSARNLQETLPEREGWVDRNKLLDITGRNRQRQISMANDYGLHDFAQPAGGCCFLTDKSYSNKLQDMWQHRPQRDYDLDDLMLLKIGRHLRPKPHFKMIIAREEGENNFLHGYRKQFLHMFPVSHEGPLALIDGELTDADIELAAAIVARFSQGKQAERVSIQVVNKQADPRVLEVTPMAADDVEQQWYLA